MYGKLRPETFCIMPINFLLYERLAECQGVIKNAIYYTALAVHERVVRPTHIKYK
jgi:hypothetical protein